MILKIEHHEFSNYIKDTLEQWVDHPWNLKSWDNWSPLIVHTDIGLLLLSLNNKTHFDTVLEEGEKKNKRIMCHFGQTSAPFGKSDFLGGNLQKQLKSLS